MAGRRGVLAACLALQVAADGSLGLVRMEGGAVAPAAGWSVTGPAPRQHMLELTFAVKQSGLEELHEALMRVSLPNSPEYGMHLSNEEVNRLTAPKDSHIATVSAFLREHGAEPRRASPNADFIVAEVSIETAERMLSAKYVELVHGETGLRASRTPGGYHLPAAVAAAVDFVAPTVHLPPPRRLVKQDNVPNVTGFGFNSPKNLRQLYDVTTEGKATNNKQAVTAFLEQYYSQTALKTFWGLFCRGITCGKGSPKLVGDATTGTPGTESMLDIETITGLAGNVESEFWGYSGRSENPQNEPFLKWLTQLSSTSDADVPKVFSTSYGEDESSWSLAAAQRLNVEFQKAGARGITLLFASGDEGANCKSGKFVPEWPSSSPYVTAVGGTAPTSSWPKPGADSESAIGLSSGGFSNYWPMPDWQKDSVTSYLKQGSILPPTSRGYNTSGRAYPDISAQATNFFVVATLPLPGVSGTSCASPTAAAVISLLNDLRLQEGKSTLGFLNPFIYQHSAAFTDITTGSSSGCTLSKGWPASAGWDAVTGVGTPRYSSLAKAITSLPAGHVVGAKAAELVI